MPGECRVRDSSRAPIPQVHWAAMAPNPKLQRGVETVIRVLAPPLDLLLAVGDRVARVLAPGNPDQLLARMPREGDAAPRGLRDR